jgi:predicted transcriptional regulator
MMATTAVPTTTMTIRLPREMRARFDALAKATGRNRNVLAQEAIRRFIEAEEWQIAEIQAGLREAEAGTFASEEEMEELWAEFGVERRRERGE